MGAPVHLSIAIVVCILTVSEGQKMSTSYIESLDWKFGAHNTTLELECIFCSPSASVFILEAFIRVRPNTTNNDEICRIDITEFVAQSQWCTESTPNIRVDSLSLSPNGSCPFDLRRFRTSVVIMHVCIPEDASIIQMCSNDTRTLSSNDSAIFVRHRNGNGMSVDTPFMCTCTMSISSHSVATGPPMTPVSHDQPVSGAIQFENFLALKGADCSQSLNVSWTGGESAVCSPFTTMKSMYSRDGLTLNATDSNLTVSFASEKVRNPGTFLLHMYGSHENTLSVSCSQTLMHDSDVTSSTSPSYPKTLSAGEIIGIAVGSFAFLVIVVVVCVALLVICRRRRRKSQIYKESPDVINEAVNVVAASQPTPAASAINDGEHEPKVSPRNKPVMIPEPPAAAEADRTRRVAYEQPEDVSQWWHTHTWRKGSRATIVNADFSDPEQRKTEYETTVVENTLYGRR